MGTSATRVVVLTALLLAACEKPSEDGAGGPSAASAAVPPGTVAPPTATTATAHGGLVERGRKLVEQFECHRCHEGTGIDALPTDKHCVRCHEEILAGTFKAPAAKLAKWRPNVVAHRDTPSLAALGARLRAEWIEKYLLAPQDLRPHLVPTMPRLAVSAEQARDIAAYLTRDAPAVGKAEVGDRAQGAALYEAKSCGACHAMTGAPRSPNVPNPKTGTEDQRRAVTLAPDLAHTRLRFRRDAMVSWLLAPLEMLPGTRMPSHSLTRTEAASLATFLFEAPLGASPSPPLPRRLPVLERAVRYDEVRKRVFAVTCHHCHLDPKETGGDGGPGNSGGFGFPPRRLDLSSYRAIASGFLGADGERHSVFEKLEDGTPRIVAAMFVRHAEDRGTFSKEVRGMPLGLPPLPLEDIQLVETWVAQGRPQ